MSLSDQVGASFGGVVAKALQEISGGAHGMAGSMAAGASAGVKAGIADTRQDKALALHQKHIHALWSHLERLEECISVNRSGELKLHFGTASITMKKSGEIHIKGANIKIESSNHVSVKASGNVDMNGSKIQQN